MISRIFWVERAGRAFNLPSSSAKLILYGQNGFRGLL